MCNIKMLQINKNITISCISSLPSITTLHTHPHVHRQTHTHTHTHTHFPSSLSECGSDQDNAPAHRLCLHQVFYLFFSLMDTISEPEWKKSMKKKKKKER